MSAEPVALPAFSRYVAIGDSTSEGLEDPYPDGRGYRGWADRLAERLAAVNPDLLYANLAIRGRLAGQVLDQQLGPALAMKPDLVTMMAGLNDMLRRHCDLAGVIADVEEMITRLADSGSTVLTFTMPDPTPVMPIARLVRPRLEIYNDSLRRIAAEQGVVLVDFDRTPMTSDRQIWAVDRLHANSEGHARIAGALAEALEVPGSDDAWMKPLPPEDSRSRPRVAWDEIVWARRYLIPRIYRHLRGRSSGDGITPKRPDLQPFTMGGSSGAST